MALAALAALTYVVAVLTACHVVRRDVDVLMQPISAYARGPCGGWFAAGLAAWGASAWLLDAALGREATGSDRVLLALFGAGLVIAALFPMDVPFPPDRWTVTSMSWIGMVHVTAASVSSMVFPVAALRLSPRLGVRGLKATAALSGVAALAVFAVAFVDVRHFGLAQRVLAALILCWLVRSAASLVRSVPAKPTTRSV